MNKNTEQIMESFKRKAWQNLVGIKEISNMTRVDPEFSSKATKVEITKKLPPYHLIYFLLIELLEFKKFGPFEKVAWSIPIDFEGACFLIDFRKFGVGIYTVNPDEKIASADKISSILNKAVKATSPYFDYVAKNALEGVKINIQNNSRYLFDKYRYFISKVQEAKQIQRLSPSEKFAMYDAFLPQNEPQWLSEAAIESFFSWTEHIFIHLAILNGKVSSGKEAADLIDKDWGDKFKSALDIRESKAKIFYDQLRQIRRQTRNYLTHGAFGKEYKAFYFHSGTGAVPVEVMNENSIKKFTLYGGTDSTIDEALQRIGKFIEYLWSGERIPAKLYIQDSDHPIILSMAHDGTYHAALTSCESMKKLIEKLDDKTDKATNMEF